MMSQKNQKLDPNVKLSTNGQQLFAMDGKEMLNISVESFQKGIQAVPTSSISRAAAGREVTPVNTAPVNFVPARGPKIPPTKK